MGYMYSWTYLESLRILILHEMGISVPEDSKMRVKMSDFVLYSSPFQRKKSDTCVLVIYMYIIAKAICIQCSLKG